jgi:hypothetical protein
MKRESYTTVNDIPELHPEKIEQLGRRIKNITTYLKDIPLTLHNLKERGVNSLVQGKYPADKIDTFYSKIEALEAQVLNFQLINDVMEKSDLTANLYEEGKRRFNNFSSLSPYERNETYQFFKTASIEIMELESQVAAIQSGMDIIKNAVITYPTISNSLSTLQNRASNIVYCDKYLLDPLQKAFHALNGLKDKIIPRSSNDLWYGRIEEDCNLLVSQTNHLKTLWKEFNEENSIEDLDFTQCAINPNVSVERILSTVLTFNQQANLLIGKLEDIEQNLKDFTTLIRDARDPKKSDNVPDSSLNESFVQKLNITTGAGNTLLTSLIPANMPPQADIQMEDMDVDATLIPPLEKLNLNTENTQRTGSPNQNTR